jgi:3-hydroxybutyrate dehydrogenase
MELNLAGKRAVVTGAGSGIGREIANRFSAAGAAVAVCDVVKDAADKVAADINGRRWPTRLTCPISGRCSNYASRSRPTSAGLTFW